MLGLEGDVGFVGKMFGLDGDVGYGGRYWIWREMLGLDGGGRKDNGRLTLGLVWRLWEWY